MYIIDSMIFTDTDENDLFVLTFEGDESEIEGFGGSDEDDEVEVFHSTSTVPKIAKSRQKVPAASKKKRHGRVSTKPADSKKKNPI